ncbi:MAG: hypothetical protein RLZZ106_123 [Cyanobacteriota bacterium]|jgi:hypothetical protein
MAAPLIQFLFGIPLTLAALVLLCEPAGAAPAQVLLMRHGHKDPAAQHYNLSPAGFQRALALASVIPACFGSPTQIISYALDPDTSKNARSYQTAVPLAVASGVDIRLDRTSIKDSRRSGSLMLRNSALQGGLLVLFWEHRHLPELAAGLGWASMPPIDDNDFDTLYRFTYAQGSSIPLVTRYSQAALLDGSQRCSALTPRFRP